MTKNIIIAVLLAYGILATHWADKAHERWVLYSLQWRHISYAECRGDAPVAIKPWKGADYRYIQQEQ